MFLRLILWGFEREEGGNRDHKNGCAFQLGMFFGLPQILAKV